MFGEKNRLPGVKKRLETWELRNRVGVKLFYCSEMSFPFKAYLRTSRIIKVILYNPTRFFVSFFIIHSISTNAKKSYWCLQEITNHQPLTLLNLCSICFPRSKIIASIIFVHMKSTFKLRQTWENVFLNVYMVGWVLWHTNPCRLFNTKSIFM